MIHLSSIKPILKKYGPTILSGLAAIGVGVTGYLSYRAGKKSCCKELMLKAIKKYAPVEEDALSNDLKAIRDSLNKDHWKDYAPPIISGVLTAGCIIASDRLHVSKETALMTAALMYKDSYKKLAEKLPAQLRDPDITAEHDPQPSKQKEVQISANTKMDIYEPYTDQWFKASQQELLWAELAINKLMSQTGEARLSDLIGMLPGMKPDPINAPHYGWSWDDDTFNEAASYYYNGSWIDFCPILVEKPNGETYFRLEFGIHPNNLTEIGL